MYNLSTVIRFEVIRTLKKKTFWIMALGFPLLIAAIGGIVYFSNQATIEAEKDIEKQKFEFVVTDKSGLINSQIVQSMTGTMSPPDADPSTYIADVKNGTLDGYIYYPEDLQRESVQAYGAHIDIFTDGRYAGVARTLLSASTANAVDPNLKAVLTGATDISFTAYRDGDEYQAIQQMILPGIFLILFYLLISFFGNQMLTSSTEEKENRVIEMLLTTIEARTLIVGKILSLIILAFIQGLVVLAPIVLGYILLHERLQLPFVDLSTLPVDWGRIIIGFMIFSASFLLFTGLLFAIGAAVPTAKEANSFFGFVMVMIFGPLYAFTLFISSPDSPIVRVLSLFPFTAPIPLMLRNAIGNISYSEALLSIGILLVTAVIVMYIAVKVFRYGALEYSRRLSIGEIFSRR